VTSLIVFPLITSLFLTISFISAACPTRLHHLENYLDRRFTLIAQFFDDQISQTLDGLERRQCSILPVTHPTSVTSDAVIKVSKTISSRVLHCDTVANTCELLTSQQTQLLGIGHANIPQSLRDPKVPLAYLAGQRALAHEAEIRLKRPYIPPKFDAEGWLIISKTEWHAMEWQGVRIYVIFCL